MSWPDTPALRMRYAAAASPPNPPPTICPFHGLLPSDSILRGCEQPTSSSVIVKLVPCLVDHRCDCSEEPGAPGQRPVGVDSDPAEPPHKRGLEDQLEQRVAE